MNLRFDSIEDSAVRALPAASRFRVRTSDEIASTNRPKPFLIEESPSSKRWRRTAWFESSLSIFKHSKSQKGINFKAHERDFSTSNKLPTFRKTCSISILKKSSLINGGLIIEAVIGVSVRVEPIMDQVAKSVIRHHGRILKLLHCHRTGT